MKSVSLTIVSLVLFFLCTISHGLYLFTDLTHLANVDADDDDDYHGPSKIRLPTEEPTISGDVEERARLDHTMKDGSRIPAEMRMFPRQCRYNQKTHSNFVEMMIKRSNGKLEMDHVTGRLRARGGQVARFPGADMEERGGVMMMMFKRPHFLIPRQQVHRGHEAAGSKGEVGGKRQESEEEGKREGEETKHDEEGKGENENGVLKRIRKFMVHF